MRLMIEQKGVLCIATFVGANIDPNDDKRVILLSTRGSLYGVLFKKCDSAKKFINELFKSGKANLLEHENTIVQHGDLKSVEEIDE